jgi:SSS family solute:Na+ symporter
MIDQLGAGPGHALLHAADWIVVICYAIGIVGLGLYVSRSRLRPEDFFLASRSSTWPVIGLALLASNISSTTLVGLAGAAYGVGISVYNYEWMAVVVLVFFCMFLLPFILKSQVYTMPEYLQRRYDGRSRLYFACLTLFLNIAVDAAGTLYGGSLLFHLIFPSTPLWAIIAGLAFTAGIYTVGGGLRAVIYTETVQAVVLLSGAVVIAVSAFHRAGGWAHVMASVAPERLSLIRPIGDPSVPWPGLLLGVPLLGFYFWCTNQFMVQRVMSAKSANHGRWGALFAGLLKLPVLFLMVLPGTCAILLFPHLPRPDLVYPTLIFNLLPAGLLGLVVAGFLAAIMSAVASTFNSASTLVTMDFVTRFWPGLSGDRLVLVGRGATISFMVLAVLWAPNIQHFESLWQYLQSILAYAVPPVVSLFLVGMFWKGANGTGAVAALAVGTGCGVVMFASNVVLHWTSIHFLYVAPILLAISAGVLVSVSLASGGAASVPTGLVWTPAFFREETAALAHEPLWMNYRVLSAVLLLATGVLVYSFR